jgi:hypothetical protein
MNTGHFVLSISEMQRVQIRSDPFSSRLLTAREFVISPVPEQHDPQVESVWGCNRAGKQNHHENQGCMLVFGLENLFRALNTGVDNFLEKLKSDIPPQKNTLNRHYQLRKTAKV